MEREYASRSLVLTLFSCLRAFGKFVCRLLLLYICFGSLVSLPPHHTVQNDASRTRLSVTWHLVVYRILLALPEKKRKERKKGKEALHK